MITKYFFLFIALLSCSLPIDAKNSVTYGLLPVVQSVTSSVNDLESESITVGNVISGLIVFESGRDTRVFVQAQFGHYEFSGTETLIGETVTTYSISTIYQSKFRMSRGFKPYFGLGLGLRNEEHTERFLTDAAGFLAQSFQDESVLNITVDVTISSELDLFDSMDSGWSIRYSQPTSDGIEIIEAGIYILF